MAQMPDYTVMDPAQIEGPDLGRWEIWDAWRRSGRSMRDISIDAGINESGINQLLSKTQFIPQPATLRALASVDILGLSYMRLMTLFGHIDPLPERDEVDSLLAPLRQHLLTVPRERRSTVVQRLLTVARMFDD